MFTHTFNKRAVVCDKYYNALQRAKSTARVPSINHVSSRTNAGWGEVGVTIQYWYIYPTCLSQPKNKLTKKFSNWNSKDKNRLYFLFCGREACRANSLVIGSNYVCRTFLDHNRKHNVVQLLTWLIATVLCGFIYYSIHSFFYMSDTLSVRVTAVLLD